MELLEEDDGCAGRGGTTANPQDPQDGYTVVQKVMSYYRVVLNGENFWLQVDGRGQRMGFFTTRFVEAATRQDAELAAVDLLRSEGRLKPLNDSDDLPRVFAGEIEEVDADAVPATVPGFAFFPDDEERTA